MKSVGSRRFCDDDYEFLGVPDPKLKSSWEHCRDIVMQAETGGFDNILLPSGYELGIDTTAFAAAIAPLLKRMRLADGGADRRDVAAAAGPPDRHHRPMLGGRLTINIISSDMPGEKLASAPRYARTVEAMSILKTMLNGQPLDHDGEFWKLKLDPPRMGTVSGKAPLIYFGGLSEDAREAAAKGCDVFLMWPDKAETIAAIIEGHDRPRRQIRPHAQVRLPRPHDRPRHRSRSARRRRSPALQAGRRCRAPRSAPNRWIPRPPGCRLKRFCGRPRGDDGYAETGLWTGVGRARSGCGAAIVGDPDQVLAKLNDYRDMGIEAFILSGYPHAAEADLFARHVLPHIDHGPLA